MLTAQEVKDLKRFSVQVRMEALKAIGGVGIGHIGGSLSLAELMAVLYNKVLKVDPRNPKWEQRDYLVVSKGHSGPAVYATLALKGFFPLEMLKTLNQGGTNLPSHCDRLKTPGIDMSTGSLGQGASSAAGIALGFKLSGKPNRVYLVLGDGECQDLPAKFSAFGWFVQKVDGHDVQAIHQAVEKAQAQSDRPAVIVLDTIKGRGVSFWEGNPVNHNIPINKEQLASALGELDTQLAAIG
jgi:transketolase